MNKNGTRDTISITIDLALLALLDEHRRGNRSAEIELALKEWLRDKRATEMRKNFDDKKPKKGSEK